MLLAVVVLALMGLARLPVPCVGDGQGHPCSMEHCACTTACSCKLACQSMEAHDSPHHACQMANMPHSAPTQHFSMPDAPPPMVIGGLFRWSLNERLELGQPGSAPHVDSPLLPLPEPPPRRLA